MELVTIVLFFLVHQSCHSLPLDEDSVVSVYTTQANISGPHHTLDVYHEIATNIADRITSPIYRFLGFGKNKTQEEKTTKKPWEKIEILDDAPEETTKLAYLPVGNDISGDRDVEELSVEALKKVDNKPEKITLYSSYLPVKSNLEDLGKNDTINEVDSKKTEDEDDEDGITLDDVENDDDEKPREGFFYYVIEILNSVVQLAWTGISALFKASFSGS